MHTHFAQKFLEILAKNILSNADHENDHQHPATWKENNLNDSIKNAMDQFIKRWIQMCINLSYQTFCILHFKVFFVKSAQICYAIECLLSIKYGSHLTENKRTWHCKSCFCFHFANDGQEKHYWDNKNIVDRDTPSDNPFQLLLEINLMENTFRYFFSKDFPW